MGRAKQVFEILVKWVEGRNWEEAFWAVIPKRKFQNEVVKEAVDTDINDGDANAQEGVPEES